MNHAHLRNDARPPRRQTARLADATPRRRGAAMVLALGLLAVLVTLAVTFISASDLCLKQSDNFSKVEAAQRQAESGLDYHAYIFRRLTLPADAQADGLVLAIATALRSRLDGTPALNGAYIIHDPNGPDDPNELSTLNDPNTITIPSIATAPDRNFSAVLSLLDDANGILQLRVTGRCGMVARSVGVSFRFQKTGPASFFGDYGIASKGSFRMTGNASVRGANRPDEANILAATVTEDEAVKLTGNCSVQGDVSIANPDGHASLSGSVSVGGESGSGALDHVHVGIGEVEFPEVDPTIFEPFATNLVTAATPTGGDLTFENIRIAAGANKTFSGNTIIKGVVFIEVPNSIHFSGNVLITGVIVTQDAGDGTHDFNTIKFTGNTTVYGVEELPDDQPQFAELRQMPGSFLLAPGFGAEFAGNFGTLSGCMAADEFKFTGNAGGTIKGGIIGYGDTELKLTGNSSLVIDRSGTPEVPPGFSTAGTATLTLVSGTYVEY